MNYLCIKLDLLSQLLIGLLALLETSYGQSEYQNSPIIEYEENPQITWLHEKSFLFDWLDQQVKIGKTINSKGIDDSVPNCFAVMFHFLGDSFEFLIIILITIAIVSFSKRKTE